ncbi:MAG: hypothetical protein ACR2L9_04535 [Solirubrobacteraceae bacterium]
MGACGARHVVGDPDSHASATVAALTGANMLERVGATVRWSTPCVASARTEACSSFG